LAAYAQAAGGTLTLQALVAEPDGSRILSTEASGPSAQAEALGESAAQALLEQGARAILDRLMAPGAGKA
jgi:hydroxymethylbilane synthase